MATKKMNILFQVKNTSEIPNTVEITLDGTTVYTGTLPETGPIITGGDSPTVTNITFDIDVPVATINSQISNMAFTTTVTGESIQIEDISTNYNLSKTNTGTQEAPVWVQVAGTDTAFTTTNIVSQPLWNGVADFARYNIEYNNGPTQITGPGEVLLNNNETVAFDVAVADFNNVAPLTA